MSELREKIARAIDENTMNDVHPGADEVADAVIEALGVVEESGKLWKVVDGDGFLWAETSSESDARKRLETAGPGAKLYQMTIITAPSYWTEADPNLREEGET